MKKVGLVTVLLCLVIVGFMLYAVILRNNSKKIEYDDVVVDMQARKQLKESEKIKAIFEVDYEDAVSEDVVILPNNYNGQFLVDDGIEYTNLVKPKVTVSKSDLEVISLKDNEAWSFLTDGMLTEYPNVPYSEVKDVLRTVYENHATTITVSVWYWQNPDDPTDMHKETKSLRLTVHDKLANLFINIFNDIYEDPSQPVINIKDAGMGTWVLRGKGHSEYRTLSAHSLGGAIDINPSSGSFSINGSIYGNAYKAHKMSKDVWESLPESHTKYHVLYEDCPIVSIFKSYGFYWGGDWENGTDCMHLAYLGDGAGRKVGYENYLKYGGNK